MQDPIAPEGDGDDDSQDDVETSASPRDFVLSGVGEGAPPPMIIDPNDGLPRPKDEGFVQNAVPAATDENLVCQEGGAWQPWTLGEAHCGTRLPLSAPVDETELRLVRVRDDKHVGPQRLYAVPGKEDLWMRSRPACRHYAELETMVTEFVLEGHDKAPRTILRKCTRLDLVLTDGVIRGCSLREPRDIVSEQRLIDRAREKEQQAKEASVGMFRSASHEEQAAVVDPAKATATSFRAVVYAKQGGEGLGTISGHAPPTSPETVVDCDPLYVFFPDEAWQPRAEVYHGLRYTSRLTGKDRVWSASLSGELLIRQAPGIEEGERIADLSGIRKMQWQNHVQAIAKALLANRNVSVVAYHVETVDDLRVALTAAVDDIGGTFDASKIEVPAKRAPVRPKSPNTTSRKTKKTR